MTWDDYDEIAKRLSVECDDAEKAGNNDLRTRLSKVIDGILRIQDNCVIHVNEDGDVVEDKEAANA